MKPFVIFSIIIFVSSLLYAKDALVETDIRTFEQKIETSPGKTFYFFDSQSDIRIGTHNSSMIESKVTIELGDMSNDVKESFFSKTKLKIKPYKDGFRLYLETPEQDWIVGETSFLTRLFSVINGDDALAISIRIDIIIPKEQSVIIENKYGDVTLSDISGEISVDNTSGIIELKRSTGNAIINNRYAETFVRDFDGDLEIKSTSSAIELFDVNGNVKIEGSYKPINFKNIGGSLEIRTTSGDIFGQNVDGA